MSRDGDRLDDLLVVLLRLRERCGVPLYRRAVAAARAAIGQVVLAEAERRAGVERPPGTVVRFPAGGRGNSDRNDA
jgi:hypothetical protein